MQNTPKTPKLLKQTKESLINDDIRTLDELIKVCEIDLDKWQVSDFAVEKTDSSNKDGTVSPKFKVRANLERKNQISQEELLNLFIKNTEKYSPKKFNYTPPNRTGLLYVLNIQDLHAGKLSHNARTGWGDFDLKIAKRVYKEAVDDLLNNAPLDEISNVLIISGSDLIHYENDNTETSQGTKLEGDSRWYKVFSECCDLITDTVDRLSNTHLVEVMSVTGNHASLSEQALANYVKAFFRFNKNVHVNNDPSCRKYFGFGRTLIGFCHGQNKSAKPQDLSVVMFREKQKEISKYKHLYWLTGHLHQDMQTTDNKGVRVFTAPALCAPDFWHSKNNFVGNIRTSQGMLFSKDDGLLQIIYSRPVE